jgi:hypothetical protein
MLPPHHEAVSAVVSRFIVGNSAEVDLQDHISTRGIAT